MPDIELSAGTISYEDSGGSGPVLVMIGGLAMNGSLWSNVVEALRDEHRCVVPTLPWGSHLRPMHPDADLSLRGHANIVAEFIERLDLRDVTLIENDTGMAQVLAGDRPERVARLVITSGEAFDNYPPGLPGKLIAMFSRLPGGLNFALQPLRLRALRRLPFFYGLMAKRPIPHSVVDGWLRPLFADRDVRRDLVKYLRSFDPRALIDAAERIPAFDRPALVVWASEDRVMPREHGRRLAELFPDGRWVEIEDSYTLLPLDQPVRLAGAIRSFVRET